MRAVWNKTDFKKNWSSAKLEASAAFGNDDMYIEKLIQERKSERDSKDYEMSDSIRFDLEKSFVYINLVKF